MDPLFWWSLGYILVGWVVGLNVARATDNEFSTAVVVMLLWIILIPIAVVMTIFNRR